jgi:hypothetical protein
MNKFLDTHDPSKLNQEESSRSIMNNEIEAVMKTAHKESPRTGWD